MYVHYKDMVNFKSGQAKIPYLFSDKPTHIGQDWAIPSL